MRRHPLSLALNDAIDMMLMQDILKARAERAAAPDPFVRAQEDDGAYPTAELSATIDAGGP